MDLCYGGKHVPILLSATRKYTPEEIREICRRVTGPFCLVIQSTPITIYGEDCLMMACHVCAAYHNWLAYNAPEDDGFQQDMEAREAEMQARWNEPISDSSDLDS